MLKIKKETQRAWFIVIIKTMLIFLWGIFIFIIAIHHVEGTTISTSHQSDANIKSLVPQGWGFFTKNPDEYISYLYKYDKESRVWKMLTHAKFSMDYFFGLSRKRGQLSMQVSYLIKKTEKSQWNKIENFAIKKTLQDSLLKKGNVYRYVDSKSKTPTLNGKYLILRKKILPWSWIKGLNNFHMPIYYVKIYIPNS